MRGKPLPLDLARTSYSYIERPNPAIQSLLEEHVVSIRHCARVLDVGCGCGANARALKERNAGVCVTGIEPNARAAELARGACDEVFQGTLEQWARDGADTEPFDALVLSDVIEHVEDPVAFLRRMVVVPALRDGLWIVSVPNYAVWYNRIRTVLGLQRYTWSGLWDRTHLRFFTRRTLRELLEYCGFTIVAAASTPSLVQSTAPILRRIFDSEVEQGNHLTLADSRAFALYRAVVEPAESRLCGVWPALLAFQIVYAARFNG